MNSDSIADRPLRGQDLGLLVATSFCCAISLFDTNVTAVASPVITQAFGITTSAGRWVISGFFLGFASCLMPAGAISDRRGRRITLLWGLIALSLASLLAGCAVTIEMLIAARVLQGVATGFVLAPALALIGHRYREPAERTRAWMIWGSIMGLTMVLSPFLGGLAVHWTGWRGAFLMNLPVCLTLAVAIHRLATESSDKNRKPPDFMAILCFAGVMFCLTWLLITGRQPGFGGPVALAVILTGLLFLAGLVLRMSRQPVTGIPLYLQPRLVAGVLAMFAYAGTAQVMASLLPVGFQVLQDSKPTQIGLLVLPFTLGMLIFPQIGGLFSARIGVWAMLLVGLATVALGTAAAAVLARQGITFSMALFVIGAGAGLMNGETQKAIMMSMPPEQSGLASGISTTARFSGVLIGFTALSGLIDTTATDMSGLAPAMLGALAGALAAAVVVVILAWPRKCSAVG